MAENMPSGSAIRPSDVLTMYGGKTVEVLNTDAEGRLVLGDALVRASEDRPDLIVDVATLTGACVVALGTLFAAAFANNDGLRDGSSTPPMSPASRFWPLPIPPELLDKLKSTPRSRTWPTSSARPGAARSPRPRSSATSLPTASTGRTWTSPARPSMRRAAASYTPAGGTGFAVRTLVRLAVDRSR